MSDTNLEYIDYKNEYDSNDSIELDNNMKERPKVQYIKSATYDVLKILVHNRKGEHLKDKDFKIKFIAAKDKDRYDATKRFMMYAYNKYNDLFDKYYIPTIFSKTFITSTTVPAYKDLPKNSIIAFVRGENDKDKKITITYNNYSYVKEAKAKEFNVKYIGPDKEEITEFPFGGFNDYRINLYSCYEKTPIKTFDFNNLIIDKCVSMERMFNACLNLKEVKNFNSIGYNKLVINDMSEMFSLCYRLENVDIKNLKHTIHIYQIQRMFQCCISLKEIDISGLTLIGKYGSDIEDSSMFNCCYNLRKIIMSLDVMRVIKNTLPFYKLWMDQRDYKHKTSNDKKKHNIQSSQKTRVLTYLNTLFMPSIKINGIFDNKDKTILLNNVVFKPYKNNGTKKNK